MAPDTSNDSQATPSPSSRPGRVLGRVSGGRGPAVIVVAAIHGNEPAGLEACRRVLDTLVASRLELAGQLVMLAGNLRALEVRERFIDLDLNRQWTPEKVAALRRTEPAAAPPIEDREQWELLAALEVAAASAQGPVHFIDLHTSSADGPPFLTIGDTLRNRRFAFELPLPVILGLEEQVDGSLLELLNNRGFVTLGVEGGKHDQPTSADHHEAVLWLALVAAGLLRQEQLPAIEQHRRRLERAALQVPHVVEVRHRHAVRPGDGFRMRAGFTNFQSIREGQELADDRAGTVRAREPGMILLPLYQGLGDDGFFIAREVNRGWLRLSALLRRLHFDRAVGWLPGVCRHPDRSDVLVVNTRIARWFPLEIFHLFGFRKLRRQGEELWVSRRRFDLSPPARISLE